MINSRKPSVVYPHLYPGNLSLCVPLYLHHNFLNQNFQDLSTGVAPHVSDEMVALVEFRDYERGRRREGNDSGGPSRRRSQSAALLSRGAGWGRRTRVGFCPCPFLRMVPNQGNQVFPVSVIKVEVHPRREEAVFCGAGNNKANILRQVLLVVLEDAAGLYFVFAPGGEKLRRNLAVMFAYSFTNEGKLPMRGLISDCWDIKEPFAD